MKQLVLIYSLLLLVPVVARAQQNVFVPDCQGVNDTAKLTALISLIGPSQGAIKIPYKLNGSGRCVVDSLTVPANITLDFSEGSGVGVSTKQTLTILGPMMAPPKQIFYNALPGQGTVSFSRSKTVSTFYPQWWGGTPDDRTDNTAAVLSTLAAADTAGGGTVDFLATSSQWVITSPLVIGTYNHPVKTILRNNLTSTSSITVGMGSQLVGAVQGPYGPILAYTGSGNFIVMAGYDGAHPALNDEDDRNSRLENFYIQGTYLGKGLGGSTTQKLIVLSDGFSHGTLANLYLRNAALGMYGYSSAQSIDKNLFLNVAFRNPLRQAVYLEAIGTSAQTGFVEMNTFINLVLRNDDSAYPTFQLKGSPSGGRTPRVIGAMTFINIDASFAGNDSLGTMFDFTDVAGVQFIGGEIAANKYGIVAHASCKDINSFGVNQSVTAAPGAEYFHDTGAQAAAQFNLNSLQTEFHVGTGVPGRRVFIQSHNQSAGDALVVGRKNNQTFGMMQVNFDSGKEQGLELLNTAANGKSWTMGDGVGAPAGSFGIYDATDSRSYFSITGSTGVVSLNKLAVGAGATISKYLSGSAPLDFAAWGGGDCQDLNIRVDGAASGDPVVLGIPDALASVAGVTWFGWVSSANTVTVRGCKITAGASTNPAAATVTASIIQH
ncbi:MAG TPA: hypothetical protein VK582_03815 [Pyrinomonadaceae bacterium]|nr:hypothetical protein [Pyrinomonadaceae bacterium]